MKQKTLLNSFERCLKAYTLEPMTKDLYNFFHLRCGFIAHFNIDGFKEAYKSPDTFLDFCIRLNTYLQSSIRFSKLSKDFTDNTDSFKYDYDFKIPEVKQRMIDLLDIYDRKISKACNTMQLAKLYTQREDIDVQIKILEEVLK